MADLALAAEALRWMTGILNERIIPFQITGGLAARSYGSTRPLDDIDIDVPSDTLKEIAEVTRQYVESGPVHFVDDDWDLLVLIVNYKGQYFDIEGIESEKVFDKQERQWVAVPGNLSTAQMQEVLGTKVPVKDPRDMIHYKRILNRTINGVPIDRNDAEAIERFLGN
ncbi:MAG: hypothetical protein HOO67_06745 [Candidatus Peribacteraceae bacterium]|nr:hypothetical protein [Candidatus Peribacteraceae bacterium]